MQYLLLINYIPSIEWDNGDIANMVYYRFNQTKIQ